MSEQPQDGHLPARFDPGALKKTAKQLTNMVRGYARDRARIRQLATFADRTSGDKVQKKGNVEWNDRPEVELYWTHRDSYERMGTELESWRQKILSIDGDGVATAMQAVARMESERSKHLASMETILMNLQKEFGGREGIMAKLASDQAKIAEAARQHEERIGLMERLKNLDGGSDTDDEKIDKLAKRFNMRPDELRQKLADGTLGIVPRDDDDVGGALVAG